MKSKISSEEEFVMDRDSLIHFLKMGTGIVSFTKKDGTSREMRCTLEEKYLPLPTEKEKTTRKENTEVLSVWDLDKNSWRSFRIDSITGITINIPLA